MRKPFKLALFLAPIPTAAIIAAVLVVGASAHSAVPTQLSHAVAHGSAPRIVLHDAGRNSTSTNWSGYATTGTTYTDVKGSWTQPAGSCTSSTTYSSFWVGIDGDGTNTVEQTGSDVDCSGGTPVYYAWYEMYPAFPVNYSDTVQAGDSFSAEVSASSHTFTLTITDHTQGWSHTVSKSSRKAKKGSAEWIAEAPSSSGGVLPLTNFGTVSFSSCTANGVSISSNPNPDEIVMVTSGGTVKAQPSGLGSGGTSFSVTWHHS